MFQHIKSVPLDAGDVAVFSHRVYHWGSSSSPDVDNPRIALAMGFSDDSFKQPCIPWCSSMFSIIPLDCRLSLISGQLIIYNKRHDGGPWPLSDDSENDFQFIAFLLSLVKKNLLAIDETYARTVFNSPVLKSIAL